MKFLQKNWWLAFAPLFFLPFLWLSSNEIILAVDYPFPMSGKLALIHSLFPWDHIENLGSNFFGAQFYPPRLLIHGLQYLFEFAHLNAEKIFLGLSLIGPALTIALMTNEIFHELDDEKRRLASIVAGYFGALNLYLMVQILDQAMVMQLIFIPLIIALSFKASRTSAYLKYGLLTALSTLGLPFLNPSSSAAGFLLVALFWAIGIAKKYHKKDFQELKGFLKFIGITIVVAILLHLWWLIPFFSSLKGFVGDTTIPTTDWLIGTSHGTSPLNVVRLIGAWDWFGQFNGQPYVPYAKWYLGLSPLGLLAIAPAVLALIGYLKRPHRALKTFGLVTLVGTFLAIGSYGLFGKLFLVLYHYIPGFWLFRSPWYKFSMWIVISFAPLIGAAAVWLAGKTRVPRPAIAFSFIALFAIISYPLVTGNRFIKPSSQRTLSTNRLTIPNYVYETAEFLNRQQDSARILLLPQLFHDTTKYTWGFGGLRSPLYDLLENRAIVYRSFDEELDYTAQLDAMRDSLRANDPATAKNVMNMLGVGYILHQKDFDTKFFAEQPSQADLEQYLSLLGAEMVFKSGQWEIYQVDTTNLVEPLASITLTDNFAHLFSQHFPKNSAYAPNNAELASELASRSGAITKLTLEAIATTKGELKTNFQVPSAGSYQIIGSLPEGVTINGKPVSANQSIELDNNNVIEIASLTKPIAFPNGDFSQNLTNWRVQNLALNADKSLKRGVTVAKDRGNSARLIANEDWIAINRTLPPITAPAVILSMDIDVTTQGLFEVAIDRTLEHTTFPIPINLKPSKHHYDFIIDGNLVKSPADLYVYLYPSNNIAVEDAYIDNITLHALTQPLSIYLVKQPAPFELANWQYERISPTRINLTTDQPVPQLVHVKEHYDPAWRLHSGDFTAKPMKVNDATMAFYIDKPGMQNFELEHSLTKPYWLGIAISATTFFGLIFGLLITKNRGTKGRHGNN